MDATRNYSGQGTIVCYFQDPSSAEKAVQELSRKGVAKNDIGIAISEREDKSTSWGDRFRKLFPSSEREEYVGHNDFDTLRHMGVPEAETRYYDQALQSGGALATVHSNAMES